jgi:23S rRNA pseudouridine1911/1915/1917 synthase
MVNDPRDDRAPQEPRSPTRPPPGESTEIADLDADVRLDKWLAAPERLGSRSKAAAALERGKVFVDDVEQKIRDGGRLLKVGEKVLIWIDRPGSARRPRPRPIEVLGDLRVIHEDEDLFVVDKPAGLLTVPREHGDENEDTVLARLEEWLDPAGRRRVFVVHRIDRGTTGLVVVARHGRAAREISAQFRRREPERRYLAVAYGVPSPAEGMWEDLLVDDPKVRLQRAAHGKERGAEAISRYRVEEQFHGAALLKVELVTGKRNQIRVQGMLRGHPLIGDAMYRGTSSHSEIKFPRPALHAARLGFLHPRSKRPLTFESPLPADLTGLITRLRRGVVQP